MSPQEFNTAYGDSIKAQRGMIADLHRSADNHPEGILAPSGIDRATGQPRTIGEHFDNHALALLCCWEVELRCP